MTCNEIEILIPAYLEGILSDEEKETVSVHLASCRRCSRALDNLKKTENLLKGLPEIDPPPFFDQRIMRKIREESAERRGILRKLFYPLRIKIPVQALVTLFIAVLVFHVYRESGPEMKRAVPLPVPVAEHQGERVTAGTVKVPETPLVGEAVERSAGKGSPEKRLLRHVGSSSESGHKEQKRDDLTVYSDESRPVLMKQEHTDAASGTAAHAERNTLPVSREDARGKEAEKPSVKRKSRQIAKQSATDTDYAAGGAEQTTSAPGPSRLRAAAAKKRTEIGLTLQVADAKAATLDIEKIVKRFNGRMIEVRHRNEGVSVTMEIAAQSAARFISRLKTIGRVSIFNDLSGVPSGNLTIVATLVIALPSD